MEPESGFCIQIFLSVSGSVQVQEAWLPQAALQGLPYTFLLMAANIFKLRGANNKFIHTSHGVVNSSNK